MIVLSSRQTKLKISSSLMEYGVLFIPDICLITIEDILTHFRRHEWTLQMYTSSLPTRKSLKYLTFTSSSRTFGISFTPSPNQGNKTFPWKLIRFKNRSIAGNFLKTFKLLAKYELVANSAFSHLFQQKDGYSASYISQQRQYKQLPVKYTPKGQIFFYIWFYPVYF